MIDQKNEMCIEEPKAEEAPRAPEPFKFSGKPSKKNRAPEPVPAPVEKAAVAEEKVEAPVEVAPAPAPKAAAVKSKTWRADPALLYPPFLKKVEQVLAECSKAGADFFVISGFRSAEEQNKLYAQGRSDKSKPKVTNAKAWESMHNFHCAVDCCRDADVKKEGLQPSWQLEDYRILAETAKKHGLEAAFFWKSFQEGPHIQLPLESRGISRDQMKAAYLSGGQKALFALLDKYSW